MSRSAGERACPNTPTSPVRKPRLRSTSTPTLLRIASESVPASVDSTLVPRRCPPRALLIAPSATVALTLDRAAGPAAASALPKILALYAAGSLLLPLLPHLCTRASQPVAVPRGRSAAACRVFTPTPAPMRRRLTLTEFECEPSLLCVFTTQLGSLARERWEKMLPRLHNYLVKAHLLENVRDPIARSSLVVTTLQSSPIFSTTGNQRSLTPGHGLLPVTKSCGLRSSVARAIHKEESACSSDLESRPGRVVSLYEQRQPQSGTIPGYFRFVTLYVTAPII